MKTPCLDPAPAAGRRRFLAPPRALAAACLAGFVVIGGLVAPAPAAPTEAVAADLPDFTVLWDFEHPDSTEARFRALLPQARASGDDDYLGQLLTQIARAQGLQGRFEDAEQTLSEVRPFLRSDRPKLGVRFLLEQGRVQNSSGRPAEAAPMFRLAWELARRSLLDDLAVDAAHMVAIVLPPDSALAWNQRALNLVEGSADPKAKGWLGSLYNNLGWTYHDRGDYEKALDLFQKALRWREEQGQPLETRIARWCVGRALRSLGRLDEALRLQLDLQADWEAAGGSDGYVQEEIAECLLALGRSAEAKPWFARAYQLLSEDPWLPRNEPERLARMAELGGLSR